MSPWEWLEVKGAAPKTSCSCPPGCWDPGLEKGGAPKASSPLSRLLLWLAGDFRGVRKWGVECDVGSGEGGRCRCHRGRALGRSREEIVVVAITAGTFSLWGQSITEYVLR